MAGRDRDADGLALWDDTFEEPESDPHSPPPAVVRTASDSRGVVGSISQSGMELLTHPDLTAAERERHREVRSRRERDKKKRKKKGSGRRRGPRGIPDLDGFGDKAEGATVVDGDSSTTSKQRKKKKRAKGNRGGYDDSDSPPARRGGRRQPDPVSYDDSSGDDSDSNQTSSSGDGSGAADPRDSGEISDDDRPRSGHRQAAAPTIDTAQAGANASDSATPVGTDGSTDTGGTPHPVGLPLPVADLSAIARRASSRTFREQIQEQHGGSDALPGLETVDGFESGDKPGGLLSSGGSGGSTAGVVSAPAAAGLLDENPPQRGERGERGRPPHGGGIKKNKGRRPTTLRYGDYLFEEETRTVEFKGIQQTQNPLVAIAEYVQKYINAFLNTDGGVIYFGVEDSGKVLGIAMDRSARDSCRLRIDAVISYFQPQVDPDLVRLEFIEVIVEGSRAGTRKSQRSLARRRKRDSAEDGSFSGLYVVGVTAMKGRSPVYLTTPTGSAYIRRDGSVHKMDQATINDRLSLGRPRASSLGTMPRDFIGRREELRRIREFARIVPTAVGVVAICGLPVVGKSALARRLVHELGSHYPDRRYYVNMAGAYRGYISTMEAMSAVVRATYPDLVIPESEAEVRGLYESCFQGLKCIMLLENVGHPDQVSALEPLTGAAAMLIVTSRKQLDFSDASYSSLVVSLAALEEDDAVSLMRATSPHLDAADARELAELCGFFPLPIRLLGGLLNKKKFVSPASMIKRLREGEHSRLELVEKSLGSVVDFADPEERRHMAMVSLFGGTFDLEAAIALFEEGEEATADSLSALLLASIVEFSEATFRFRVNDLLRLFLYGRLVSDYEADEVATLKRRFVNHFRGMANDLATLPRNCAQTGGGATDWTVMPSPPTGGHFGPFDPTGAMPGDGLAASEDLFFGDMDGFDLEDNGSKGGDNDDDDSDADNDDANNDDDDRDNHGSGEDNNGSDDGWITLGGGVNDDRSGDDSSGSGSDDTPILESGAIPGSSSTLDVTILRSDLGTAGSDVSPTANAHLSLATPPTPMSASLTQADSESLVQFRLDNRNYAAALAYARDLNDDESYDAINTTIEEMLVDCDEPGLVQWRADVQRVLREHERRTSRSRSRGNSFSSANGSAAPVVGSLSGSETSLARSPLLSASPPQWTAAAEEAASAPRMPLLSASPPMGGDGTGERGALGTGRPIDPALAGTSPTRTPDQPWTATTTQASAPPKGSSSAPDIVLTPSTPAQPSFPGASSGNDDDSAEQP